MPGDVNERDNSFTRNLMSSLSCDIHKSLPIAVLNFECLSLSHLTWSSFEIVCIWLDLPLTLKRSSILSMSFWGNLLTLMIRPKNSTGWSGARYSACLRLKVSCMSLANFWTEGSSPAMTKSSTYAVTMRLIWPEESKPVKVHGPDFICLRLLRICHDLVESLRPETWRLNLHTVGSGYWISGGAWTWMDPFDSSTGVLRNAEATSDTPRLHRWVWLIQSMILSVVAFSTQWSSPGLHSIVDWEELGHILHDLQCWVRWAPSWSLPLLPVLSSPEDLLDTLLEVWNPEAIEVIDRLRFDHYWLSSHWSPRFLA